MNERIFDFNCSSEECSDVTVSRTFSAADVDGLSKLREMDTRTLYINTHIYYIVHTYKLQK
jgi:hypothetical protein